MPLIFPFVLYSVLPSTVSQLSRAFSQLKCQRLKVYVTICYCCAVAAAAAVVVIVASYLCLLSLSLLSSLLSHFFALGSGTTIITIRLLWWQQKQHPWKIFKCSATAIVASKPEKVALIKYALCNNCFNVLFKLNLLSITAQTVYKN